MGGRPAESASSGIDALFRLGVVTGLSDGQLLERFVTRSDAEGQLAFEAIVRRHGPMVLGVCRRVLGHQQAAEDAFQASFMVLALKAGAVRSRESLGPWLHRVAARVARRALLSSRRHPHEPLPAEDLVDAATTSEPAPADLSAVLDEELGRLPDKYRIPVVLCYLEGQTQEQAARTLGWTKGTVSGRLARAKDLLRVRLARRGLAPSAVLLAGALAPETASAAVPSSLMTATVRVVVAAVLGGAEAGLASGSVSHLARTALKWMLVARLVRATVLLLVMGTAAAAVAMPMLISGGPARPGGPGVARAAARVPGAARPGPPAPAPRVDLYGAPLPDRAAVRLGTIQRRHAKRVVGVEFARGGKTAVSVQADGLARFWDVATGQQAGAVELMGEVRDPYRFVQHFAISPDGRTLAAIGAGLDPAGQRGIHSLWIWELEPQRLRHRLQVQAPIVYSLAFSPDGATVALGGLGGDVQLWDVASGSRRAAKVGNFPVTSIGFAPDGQSFAATSQARGVTVWDLEEGRGTVLAGLKGSAFPLRFSPDGRLLAVPQTGEGIALWDRTVGEVRLGVPGTVVAFAPDSRTMAVLGKGDGTMTVLDARTGAERWQSDVGWGSFANLAFSPDGNTILTEGDGVLRFFDADSGRERFGLPEAHQAGVTLVRYAPDGRTIFTGGNDSTLREWDAETARHLRAIPVGAGVSLLAISPDGRTLATASQPPRSSIAVWDVASGQRGREWSWPGATVVVDGLAFSSDGEALLVFLRNAGLKVVEIAMGRERPAVQPRLNLAEGPFPGAMVSEAAFSPGNRFLAVDTGTTIHVADLATGVERFSSPSRGMAFTPDGKGVAVAVPARRDDAGPGRGRIRAFGGDAEAIDVVDLDSGKGRRIELPRELVAALAVSPDGNILAVAGGLIEPVIRLYRTDDGRELGSFTLPAAVNRRSGLAFSPDGRRLAAGLMDTSVPIWDLGVFIDN